MSDERHQTWNLALAYVIVVIALCSLGALLIHGAQMFKGGYIVLPPETCYAALAERPSSALQGYELRACRAAGVDLEEADAHRAERRERRLTPAESAAQQQARAASWARSFGAPPPAYDRARFCATPGLGCYD